MESEPITKDLWDKIISSMHRWTEAELKAMDEFVNMTPAERRAWEKENKKWMHPF